MQDHARRLSGVALTLPLVGALIAATVAVLVLSTGCQVPGAAGTSDVQLALSVPVETDLGLSNIPAAKDVWVQMIDSAQKTLEFGEFYATNQAGEALEPVLQAVERAGARGVQIRWIFEKSMLSNDPATYTRIQNIKNSTMRVYDISKLTGGIIHAKYFVVDGKDVFVGSQNFDWRALDQIHET